MHILYLHQYFVPPDGPGGTRSYEFARRLVAAGHRVTLITSSGFFPKHYTFNTPVTDLELDGIHLKVIRVPYSNRQSYARRTLAFVDFAVRSTWLAPRVRDVDVIFATSTPLTIAVPAIVAKRRLGCPMVFEVRDLWPELPIAMGALRNPLAIAGARWLEKLAYRNSERIVALSPGMHDGVVRAGTPAERVTVIPNASDVDLFRVPADHAETFLAKHPHLRGRTLVTYAGTLGPINGVDYLARMAAVTRTQRPDVAFVVAGDGREAESIRRLAAELDVLDRNFYMLPPLPKREMPSLLSASSLATSLFINLEPMWNNSANKFFDALAAGRPILVNYGGWQADLIAREQAGIVAPPDDPATGATKLLAFLGDQNRVARARAAAARLADTEFNRDLLAQQLISVLEHVDGAANARPEASRHARPVLQ